MKETRHPNSIRDVVENGLCIGCGLCEALAPDRWKMAINKYGRLRPAALISEERCQDQDILSACPGAYASAHSEGAKTDELWGSYSHMGEAWAGNPDIRYRAATGGVLTALGVHLLKSGKASFILHCEADTEQAMRTRWCISETPEQVVARAGSRYGPSDTLAGLEFALARQQKFAIIAKPCDAGAVRARAVKDPRIDSSMVALLVMVCGGASDLGKSQSLLDEFGLRESELKLFRYRGFGNPGLTRVETKDGRVFEKTYQELWKDEGSWRIQPRCKICPDANGEAADIAAADIWPGGSPKSEDQGFNGVITRTPAGQKLYESAISAGDLVAGKIHTPRDYDHFQPHQVSKKHALAARLRGLSDAGRPVYQHVGLRLDTLDDNCVAEQAGAKNRAEAGRFDDSMPSVDSE
ncbi:MAG: Coenzyme F420 hydrogenase/dehydrogenase, beta subunit C-terminal domain [Pseudomonadota bacterium]